MIIFPVHNYCMSVFPKIDKSESSLLKTSSWLDSHTASPEFEQTKKLYEEGLESLKLWKMKLS